MHNNNVAAAVGITASATPRAGGIRVRWDTAQREANEPGWRLDTTEVHLSTLSSYSCTANTLVTTVRGNQADLYTSGNGQPLVAGVTWYPKLRYRDVDGNISVGTVAGLSPVEVRFTELALWGANTLRATSSTVEYSSPVSPVPVVIPFDSVSSPGYRIPADSYNTTTRQFKFPRNGRVKLDGFMHLSLRGDKTGLGNWVVTAAAQLIRSSSVFRTFPLWRLDRGQLEAAAGIGLGGSFAAITLGNTELGCSWDYSFYGLQDDEVRIVLIIQSAASDGLIAILNGQASPAVDSYSNFAYVEQGP